MSSGEAPPLAQGDEIDHDAAEPESEDVLEPQDPPADDVGTQPQSEPQSLTDEVVQTEGVAEVGEAPPAPSSPQAEANDDSVEEAESALEGKEDNDDFGAFDEGPPPSVALSEAQPTDNVQAGDIQDAPGTAEPCGAQVVDDEDFGDFGEADPAPPAPEPPQVAGTCDLFALPPDGFEDTVRQLLAEALSTTEIEVGVDVQGFGEGFAAEELETHARQWSIDESKSMEEIWNGSSLKAQLPSLCNVETKSTANGSPASPFASLQSAKSMSEMDFEDISSAAELLECVNLDDVELVMADKVDS
eukprot:scaffold900_cov430-Prasinococcus_capsulatus_cf.AAC.9